MEEKKFVIVTDTNADFPEEYLKNHGLGRLCLSFSVDGKTFCADQDVIDEHAFYDQMRAGADVKTMQVNPEKARAYFEEYLKNGVEVLYLAFSSGLSGSYNSARIAAEELIKLSKDVPEGKHIVTGDIRRLSGRLYRQAGVKDIGGVLALCGELLELWDWAAGVIAFDWAYRVKGQYTPDVYPVFYRWLKEYVRGWGDCDDFCTHAFGELLRQHKELFPRVKEWTEDRDFWLRRASAVILIPSVMRDDYAGLEPYAIADRLLKDPHDLVQKGYGWMLKCLSRADREGVINYLTAHCRDMPRVAYRYALEKLDRGTRVRLMAL